MNNLVPTERIEGRIFLIRGQKVMLDFDLAELYGVSTSRLNEQVKRNCDRFPEDFMFSLSKQEILRISQFAISSGGAIKESLKFSKNVNVFTEQGIAMLSGVLRGKRAVSVNIAIMRTFVKLKQLVSSHRELGKKIKELEDKCHAHDIRIDAIFDAIRKMIVPANNPTKRIGFKVTEEDRSGGLNIECFHPTE